MKLYSLRHSRRVMHHVFALYKRKWKKLSPSELDALENDLERLDKAIMKSDRNSANELAQKLETFARDHFKKTLFDHFFEFAAALAFALVVATIIRQTWFEPYKIPTGSMRPTIKEGDYMVVSKTDFGINIPMKPDHFYFDPDRVLRTGIITFTVEDLDVPFPDTTYFGIFPSKKRYVKRLMAKPGDILYFYGGKIYGIDKDGRDLTELRNSPHLKKIDHIPFISFEGNTTAEKSKNRHIISTTTFHQMNHPIANLTVWKNGKVEGKLLNDSITSYGDLWGFKNYATARLLTKKQVTDLTDFDVEHLEDGLLYLELRHSPSLPTSSPILRQSKSGDVPHAMLKTHTTIIPLQQRHLDAIKNNFYTSRFVIKNGHATQYNANNPKFSTFSPTFTNVPDGCYEFYYGTGYSVGFGGIVKPLTPDHPLYDNAPNAIQKIFNTGMDMLTFYEPSELYPNIFPSRYAYFRDGDLYLMGAAVINKGDTTLETFLQRENDRKVNEKGYSPFCDYGPPLKDDGMIDEAFIKAFGIEMPEKMYLALGDNHAQSGDSREFGFVPEKNLRGAPLIMVWPPGDRLGTPNQPHYPWFTVSRITIWSIAIFIGIVCYIIYRTRIRKPHFKKLSH